VIISNYIGHLFDIIIYIYFILNYFILNGKEKIFNVPEKQVSSGNESTSAQTEIPIVITSGTSGTSGMEEPANSTVAKAKAKAPRQTAKHTAKPVKEKRAAQDQNNNNNTRKY
jgi:hypothetical protein